MQSEDIARNIGKYKVIGPLGRGSMGVVYKARDPEIGRDVAVKTLRKIGSGQFHDADQALARFRLEARSAGNLRHPNIITIFEVSRDGDTPFLVMDYVQGESLDAIIKNRGKLSLEQTFSYLKQAALGLDYAHERGVIHRDIKPSNLLVDQRGTVFILDFGVATITGSFADNDDSSGSSMVMGTPGYMSPEQILNEKLDARSDLFSLAIVAFECLTGKRPFPGDNFTAVVGNILEANPLSLLSFCPELPHSLEEAFEKALSKKREERFSSAEQLILALSQAAGIDLSVARPTNTSGGSKPSRERKPSLWEPFRAKEADSVESSTAEALATSGKSQPTPAPNPASAFGREGGDPWAGQYKKAGDMFKGYVDTTSPRKNTNKKSDSRLPLIVGLLCLGLGAGLLYYLYGASTSQTTTPIANNVAPKPTASSASTFANEQNTQIVTEQAPAGKPIQEMNGPQILGVLTNPKSDESQLIQALREAKHRSLQGLPEACLIPLKSDSYLVRIEAIKVLMELGDKSVVPQLLVVLDDHDPLVRIQAAKALGVLGNRAALGYLSMRVMKEDNSEVKEAMKKAIDRINGFVS